MTEISSLGFERRTAAASLMINRSSRPDQHHAATVCGAVVFRWNLRRTAVNLDSGDVIWRHSVYVEQAVLGSPRVVYHNAVEIDVHEAGRTDRKSTRLNSSH